MASPHKTSSCSGMAVATALLEALGVPPGVIRAQHATLQLPIDGLPTMDLTVMVLPGDTGEAVTRMAEALRAAGLVVHLYPTEIR